MDEGKERKGISTDRKFKKEKKNTLHPQWNTSQGRSFLADKAEKQLPNFQIEE